MRILIAEDEVEIAGAEGFIGKKQVLGGHCT